MDYVRDALRGLRLIFHSKPVHQVPLAQMVETIAVPKPSQALLGARLMQCFCPCYSVHSSPFSCASGCVSFEHSKRYSDVTSLSDSKKRDHSIQILTGNNKHMHALQSGTAGRA